MKIGQSLVKETAPNEYLDSYSQAYKITCFNSNQIPLILSADVIPDIKHATYE